MEMIQPRPRSAGGVRSGGRQHGPGAEPTMEQVWDDLTRGLDAELCDCTSCRAARAGLASVDRSAEEWRAEVEREPQQPSANLKSAIMEAVRTEFRSGPKIALRRTDAGELSVRESAVSELVRKAVESVPGVQPRGCRTVSDPAQPGKLHIHAGLSVAVDLLEPAMIGRVRHAIRERLQRELGVREVTVDLAVEDVHDD